MAEINPLAKLLSDFCFNTIMGHESGMYKALKGESMDTLRTEVTKSMIQLVTVDYLNKIFVSLIVNDDPYVVNKFDEMRKINNHSPICLLTIMMVYIMEIHLSLDRTKLDISTYEKYMDSVLLQLTPKFEEALNKLSGSISHKCTGIDIKTCNPALPLFFTD